jgi:hypothetical protein
MRYLGKRPENTVAWRAIREAYGHEIIRRLPHGTFGRVWSRSEDLDAYDDARNIVDNTLKTCLKGYPDRAQKILKVSER